MSSGAGFLAIPDERLQCLLPAFSQAVHVALAHVTRSPVPTCGERRTLRAIRRNCVDLKQVEERHLLICRAPHTITAVNGRPICCAIHCKTAEVVKTNLGRWSRRHTRPRFRMQ